jgi:cell wall-associated NlpC family hydrolase
LLPAKHAAIVTGPNKMVHAHDGAAVAEVALAPWWRRRLAYPRATSGRLLESATTIRSIRSTTWCSALVKYGTYFHAKALLI